MDVTSKDSLCLFFTQSLLPRSGMRFQDIITVANAATALAELPLEYNPRHWSTGRKWVNVGLIAIQDTFSPISSTLLAVGQGDIDAELSVGNPRLTAMPVAMFVLGLGLGPLYLAPLSEMFGRRIVYNINTALCTLATVGCALVHNDAGLIVLRLIAGLTGAAGPGLGGGTIGDMFAAEDRGGAQAVYALGVTLGPVIGGIMGGYITEHLGWRWSMWICAIVGGITTVACVLLFRETYAPYLLARLRGQRYAPTSTGSFTHAITRPLRMLFFAPIATVMSLYMAIVYGMLYLQIVTIPLLFGPTPLYGLFTYGWTNGNDGLAYLSVGAGVLLSFITSILTLNRSYRALCKRYGEEKPEYRMPYMQVGMLIAPAGMFMYGWAAQAREHWIVPLIGGAIFIYGGLISFTCIQVYIVDAFGKYAASGLAGAILLRSVGAALFCIFGANLYQSLGYGWGSSVVALICVGALPIPTILWIYGERLRAHPFIF
ncbi:hypothetical protein CERSUDRAFT_68483 [Gelatoporia subvermispora B]|uniref:Major facilitator superfamily (MFS) profile domain-containing protein n=1 Tax=Ceriporiopsis subvermispora (strain B) TaxID=914234 RepID=M2R1K0_CERS8|nr:hypothetical protein CERSUDRAFT_68483 [Gelatoporia subvermispora B]